MFPKLRGLESSFRMIRGMCIVVVVGSLLLCALMFIQTSRVLGRIGEKVYILADEKVLKAVAGERKDNILVEARGHVRAFHTLFFNLDPDDKAIEENISRALYLSDASAKHVYENLRESGYYTGVISANISQRLTIDSIQIDTRRSPYYFRLYGMETIIRTTSIATRNLVTEGYLREVSRTDNNEHGLLIERWEIIENRDMKVESR